MSATSFGPVCDQIAYWNLALRHAQAVKASSERDKSDCSETASEALLGWVNGVGEV